MGIVAGIYPALYLSRFQPINAIMDNRFSGVGKPGMRKALSVSQFVVSLFFVVSSLHRSNDRVSWYARYGDVHS